MSVSEKLTTLASALRTQYGTDDKYTIDDMVRGTVLNLIARIWNFKIKFEEAKSSSQVNDPEWLLQCNDRPDINKKKNGDEESPLQKLTVTRRRVESVCRAFFICNKNYGAWFYSSCTIHAPLLLFYMILQDFFEH